MEFGVVVLFVWFVAVVLGMVAIWSAIGRTNKLLERQITLTLEDNVRKERVDHLIEGMSKGTVGSDFQVEQPANTIDVALKGAVHTNISKEDQATMVQEASKKIKEMKDKIQKIAATANSRNQEMAKRMLKTLEEKERDLDPAHTKGLPPEAFLEAREGAKSAPYIPPSAGCKECGGPCKGHNEQGPEMPAPTEPRYKKGVFK